MCDTSGVTCAAWHCCLLPLQVRTTRAGIVDYFSSFLTRSPQGRIDQSQIRMLSPNLALHSGVYSFTLEEEGKLKIVQVGRRDGCGAELTATRCLCGCIWTESAWLCGRAVLHPSVLISAAAVMLGFSQPTPKSLARSVLRPPNGRLPSGSAWAASQGPALLLRVADMCAHPPHPTVAVRPQARFTFLYKQVNGQWKIAEHHSSAMPEVQPAGVAEMFDRWNTALQVGPTCMLQPSLLTVTLPVLCQTLPVAILANSVWCRARALPFC